MITDTGVAFAAGTLWGLLVSFLGQIAVGVWRGTRK